MPKTDVPDAGSLDIEDIGILVLALVAARRASQQGHLPSGRDHHAMKGSVAQGETSLDGRGRIVSEQFLHRATDQAGVRDQLRALLRMTRKGQRRPAEKSGDRLVARDIDHRNEHQQFAVVQPA